MEAALHSAEADGDGDDDGDDDGEAAEPQALLDGDAGPLPLPLRLPMLLLAVLPSPLLRPQLGSDAGPLPLPPLLPPQTPLEALPSPLLRLLWEPVLLPGVAAEAREGSGGSGSRRGRPAGALSADGGVKPAS